LPGERAPRWNVPVAGADGWHRNVGIQAHKRAENYATAFARALVTELFPQDALIEAVAGIEQYMHANCVIP
jgi:hypothetical protein